MKPLQLASFVAGVMLAFNMAAETTTNQTLTVKVQDVSGKPVAGAKVEYYTNSLGNPDQKLKEPGVATTDTNGTARIAMADMGQFVVRKTGMSLEGLFYTAKTPQPIIVTLDEAASLSGVVVDESNQPVSDAQVSVMIMAREPRGNQRSGLVRRSVPEPLREILSARTSADGRFRIEGLAPDCSVDLTVNKTGKALVPPKRESARPGAAVLMARAGQQDVKLVVQPAASIEGKVVIPEEGKKSQISLALFAEPRRGGGTVPQTEAKPDGSFRFDGLVAGTYRLQARFGTSTVPDWVATSMVVSVESGQARRDVTVTATRGGILEVTAFSKEGHKPIRDARVYVTDQSTRGSAQGNGITGVDGAVSFRLAPGEYGINTSIEGAQSETTLAQIEEGKTNRVEVEITPPSQISGTVRDTNGAPAVGVEVSIFPVAGPAIVKTDTNGHFQIQNRFMNDRNNFTPFLLIRDVAHNLAASRDVEEGTETYDLQLAPASVISGRVLNEQGKPLTNASVMVIVYSGNSGWGVQDRFVAKFDAEGRFEVGAMPMGRRYGVSVTAKGYGSASPRLQEADAARMEFDPFTLKVADKKIAGVVVDSDEKPVAGAHVYTYGEGQPNASVQTDEKGRFTIDEVCEGTVQVSASISGNGTSSFGSMRVEAGDTNVVVTLGRQGGMTSSQPSRASLVGKPLPDLAEAGISSDALQTNKPMLICLFDPEQRPSRRAVRLLGEQNDSLKQKGITVVGVFAALTTADALKEWKQTNPTPFAIGGVTEKNDKTQWVLKTEKFPWLILTDAQGRVKAEGFELDELDAKLK